MTRKLIASACYVVFAVVVSVAPWSSVDIGTAAAQVRQNNGIAARNNATLNKAYLERERVEFESRMGGIYSDRAVNRYVARIGAKLAEAWVEFGEYFVSDYRFSFAVLDNPRVGAYVLSAGHVYVTRGLLTVANAEDEIAAAMAHEMAHVLADHAGVRRAQGESLRDPDVLQAFNHQQELQADQLSLEVLKLAEFDPAAQVRMLKAVSADTSFYNVLAHAAGRPIRIRTDTHPEVAERIERLEAVIGSVGAAESQERRDKHLDVVNGLVYGEMPRYGIVRGRTYYDAGWRYTFTVPPEFSLFADASYVQAIGPDGASIRIERRRTRRRGRIDIQTYLRRYASGGVQLEDIEEFHLSGMSAAMGRAGIDTESGPADMRVVAIRFSSRTVFRMQMQTPHALTQSLSDGLRNTVSTFRRLSRDEAQALKPYRVQIVDVDEGTTLEQMAARMDFIDSPKRRFALLNGLSVDDQYVPKGRVKLVVQ